MIKSFLMLLAILIGVQSNLFVEKSYGKQTRDFIIFASEDNVANGCILI